MDEADRAAVIAHMNTDHAYAVLMYAWHYAARSDALRAQITGLCYTQLNVQIKSRGNSTLEHLDIALIEPIVSAADARCVLIKMARESRAALDDVDS